MSVACNPHHLMNRKNLERRMLLMLSNANSIWAMIPVALLIVLLVARIKGEEKELLENLEGYKAYVMKTKYRLLPRIW